MSANPETQPESFKHFEVTPLTPVIGARIEGLHLADLNDASAEELRRLVWRYGVVFAPEQNLTPDQQKKRCALVCRRVGESYVWQVPGGAS